MTIKTFSGILTNDLKNIARERLPAYQTLTSGGRIADWHMKTPEQINNSISSDNSLNRINAYQTNAYIAEERLRVQAAGLKTLMDMAGHIQNQYIPGYIIGSPVLGLQSDITQMRDNLYLTLTMRSPNGDYVFGGQTSDSIPIQDIRNTTNFPGLDVGADFSAHNFSYATPGQVQVYLNDNRDTANLSTIDTTSSEGILQLTKSLMLLAKSTTGQDEQSKAASNTAEIAFKRLAEDYEVVLQQIQNLSAIRENLDEQRLETIATNTGMCEDSPEEALAKIQQLNSMESITQQLLLDQQRLAKKATELMERK